MIKHLYSAMDVECYIRIVSPANSNAGYNIIIIIIIIIIIDKFCVALF